MNKATFTYFLIAMLFIMPLMPDQDIGLGYQIDLQFQGSNQSDIYLSASYMSDQSGLSVDSFSSKLIQVGHLPEEGIAHDVFVQGNYAYLADDYAGLEIYDVSDSSNPIMVGQFSKYDDVVDVRVHGDYAYVVDWTNGLAVIASIDDNLITDIMVIWRAKQVQAIKYIQHKNPLICINACLVNLPKKEIK